MNGSSAARRCYALTITLVAAVSCVDTGPSTGPLAVVATSALVVSTETFFGPERFERRTGAPTSDSRTIDTRDFEAPFTLHVSASGTGAPSSASVTLDGKAILGPSDFKNRAQSWAIPVSPSLDAVLAVSIAGAPGSALEVSLEGKRRHTIFCPSGEPGTIADLSDAVAATPAGGTILVCDGMHVLDEEVIDRPLTLRAQHSGQATIRDADPAPTFEVARPAIWIRGIASGVVRIADLKFEPLGRAIEAAGSWTTIELDSLAFVGRSMTTATPISTRSSSNPAARMEITNSSFETMFIGLFAGAAAEFNVRRSSFRRFTQGSATLSSNANAPGTHASGTIEFNSFRECPFPGCVRFLGLNARIANNTFDMPAGPNIESAIRINRVTATMAGRTPIIIEDNIVTGARIDGIINNPEGWSIGRGIWIVDGAGNENVIRRNRFTNVWMAALLTADVYLHDNVFSTGRLGLAKVANATNTTRAHRNDITGFAFPINIAATATNTSDLRCNWWGTTAGAANNVPHPIVQVSPWASEPIANRPEVVCTP